MSMTELFHQLQLELDTYKPAMNKVAQKILDEQLSNYPIFVIHKQETQIGLPIINKEDTGLPWSVNISTLEEFLHKEIVQKDREQKFKDVYKSPLDFFCIFAISSLGAQFIFLPR